MDEAINYRLIKNCRLCNSSNLKSYFDFGNVPLGNNLMEDQADSLLAERYPLSVNRCFDCDHFQLTVAVDPDKLYATNYTYLSGVGKSFITHLHEYALWVEENFNLQSGSLVVDIGSNDGSCLKEFKNLGYRVCGVDPASMPADIANASGIPTINSFFDENAVKNIIEKYGKADFITSHNVLAHVDDLRSVFKNIYGLLKIKGYFCFEIGYFKEVLEKKCFDTIYHEHLDYHHARPLAQFLCEMGFDLIDLSINDVQGGSLRLFLQKTGDGKVLQKAQDFLNKEFNSILYKEDVISSWQSQIKTNMLKFGESIKKHVSEGKTVVGYGVPTKATLLTAISELSSSDISFMIEDNELKINRFMPGSGIPILDATQLYIKKPEVIVIFAWNFRDDIIAKLRKQIDWPVSILVPLPEFIEESY